MKKIGRWTIFGLTLAVSSFFVMCSNPIMETWWPNPTDDPGAPASRQGQAFHVVRFNVNGGAPAVADQLIADGEKVAKIQAVNREHYGFGGWFANASLTGNSWDFTGNTVTRGLILYARWIPIPCVVTFEANGGNPVPEKQLLVSGTKIGEPVAMNLSGRGFGGWFRDEHFVNEWNFALDTADSDLTLYAKWESVHHAVTFEADGGWPAPETQLVAHGARIVAPQAMTRANYGFGGWFADAGLSGEWNFTLDTVTEATTLYAKWEPNFHTVKFLVNGGFPAPTDLRIAHGSGIPAPAPLSRAGFLFGGWFTDAGFANEWNFALDKVSGNTTLHAKWERMLNVFTVTFDADPGVAKIASLASPWPDSQSVAEGTKIAEPASLRKPVAPGVEVWYGFGGWFTDAALTDKWNFAAGTVDRNLTLYAKWDTFHCTVTFEANGGIPAPAPQDLVEGANVKEPLAMTRAGHGFGGWFSNEAFSRQWNFQTDVVTAATANLTLYAKWVSSFYRITFAANGGTPAPSPQTVAHEGLVTPPLPMTRTGMDFDGWFADAGFQNAWNFASPVTADTTLHAKWNQIYFTVDFVAAPSANPPSQSVASGGRAVQPNPAAPGDGRALDGWFTEDGTGGNWGRKWNFATDAVTEPVILFAKWAYQTRTVVLKANGGILPSGLEMPSHFPIPAGSGAVRDPGTLVRTGYSFGGWFTDLEFTDPWNFSVDRITEPDEAPGVDPFYLYAKWTANPYLVSFDVHNGGATQPAAQQIAHGERVERPVATAAGEVLAGWYREPGYFTEWNFDRDVVGSSMTLHAKWEAAVYTVEFNMREPPVYTLHPEPEDQRVAHNGRIVEPFMPPLPSGNTTSWAFYRWDYSTNGSEDPGTFLPWNFDTVVTENITLHARWVPPVEDMVWVPRGSFVMGNAGVSGSPATYHAYPTRTVTLDGFYIGRNPVTQELFESVMLDNDFGITVRPSQFQAGQPTRPVERVSWYDAIAFTNAFSVKRYLQKVFEISGSETSVTMGITNITGASVQADWTKNGFRLPTEAEWEFAARGGHGSPGGFAFAGSDDANAVAWFNTNSLSQTHPVETKAANSLGIYDMNGNVSEWCWDWFSSYTQIIGAHPTTNAYDNPRGPANGIERVRRGGSWNNAVGNVRNVVRSSATPASANWVIGFRLAKSPGPEIY